MEKAIELIQRYKQLHPAKWDDALQDIRERLKELGFYRLPVYERESILQAAKPTGTKVSRN